MTEVRWGTPSKGAVATTRGRRLCWPARRFQMTERNGILAGAAGRPDSLHALFRARPVADLLYGGTEDVRAETDRLAKMVRSGGVLSVAVPASTILASDAAAELNRLQAMHGIGRDLVLRNTPPVRVHRLRYGAPDLSLA